MGRARISIAMGLAVVAALVFAAAPARTSEDAPRRHADPPAPAAGRDRDSHPADARQPDDPTLWPREDTWHRDDPGVARREGIEQPDDPSVWRREDTWKPDDPDAWRREDSWEPEPDATPTGGEPDPTPTAGPP